MCRVLSQEMIALRGELSSPLPVNVSALTPNAQARARLGEIADSESVSLQVAIRVLPALMPQSFLSSPAPIDARSLSILPRAHALMLQRLFCHE